MCIVYKKLLVRNYKVITRGKDDQMSKRMLSTKARAFHTLVRQIQVLLLKASKLGEKRQHYWTECLSSTSQGRKHVLTMKHVQAVNRGVDVLVVVPQQYTRIFRLHKSKTNLEFHAAGKSNFVWASHDSGDWEYVVVSPMLKTLLEQYIANENYLCSKKQIKFSSMNERQLAKHCSASPAWLAKFANSQPARLARLVKLPSIQTIDF